MNLSIFLETDSFFVDKETMDFITSRIEDLEIVREQAIENGDKLLKSDDIYEVPFINGDELYKWLYDSLTPEHEAIRRLLMKLVHQSGSVGSHDYISAVQAIKGLSCGQPMALMCFMMEDFMELHIRDFYELILSHRFYLRDVKLPEEFSKSTKYCYPNLVFNSDVDKTLKTLSAPLNEYIGELNRHLSALNDSFLQLFSEYKSQSLTKVLEMFSAGNQIICSMEGNPASAKKRFAFTFQADDGNDVTVICEPHTKLEHTGKAGDTEYRFDRIYFHPGIEAIAGGKKVLVGHIGMHL